MRLDAWLGAGVMDFDYEEFDQGASLDREEGYLPGVSAGLRLARGRMFAETALEAWTGGVDYASATEITTTDEDILDWNVMAGRDLFAQADQRLGLYAGLGYRHWQRDIRSTPTAFGLDETYRWWYASRGAARRKCCHAAGQFPGRPAAAAHARPSNRRPFQERPR